MATPPRTKKPIYNQHLYGVYGEFGAGAGVQAFYIQSAITPDQLVQISLISDIQGSERWPVPDLFQRDVDNQRVTKSLLPYLQDVDKIKFFNPLTLTILPMNDSGTKVLTKMPTVTESLTNEDDNNWKCLERKNYYRIRWIEDNPQYAEIQWHDIRSRLVAIDGQHRLSALKRFLRDNEGSSHLDFMKWRIPVVVVSFRAGEGRSEPPSVLEVVRSIFVYINTEAKEVNEARKILLSDERVDDVCTQEFLERSHSNDLRPRSKRDSHRLPLLFFDWRGEESAKREVHAPAAAKSVEEVRNWFRHYILGDQSDDRQLAALDIDPTHPLHAAFHDQKLRREQKLSHAASKQLRHLVNQNLLPAISYLLENFMPYRLYVSDLRKLEREYQKEGQSDLTRHAFHELRFGTNYADDSIRSDVRDALDQIKKHIDSCKKERLCKLIDLDIGMRGIVCAFGDLRGWIGNPPWMKYAELFTGALNRLYEDGWMDLNRGTKGAKFLRHIAEDHNESVVNYRLGDVDRALGAYVELLVAVYSQPWPVSWKEEWPVLREDRLDTLLGTLVRGYKKQVRPQLKEKFPSGGRELTDAVRNEAEKLAGRQLRRLERELDKIEKSLSNS